MTTRRVLAALWLSMVLVAPRLQAGAWTQPAGATYQKLGFSVFESKADYDRFGDELQLTFGGILRDEAVTWYQEWGLSDELTFFSTIPLKRLTFDNQFTSYESTGVGDIALGLKRQLFRTRGPVGSVQYQVKLPWAYAEDDFLERGNGEFEHELRLLVGAPLSFINGYAGLEAGYRERTGNPGDEWRFLAEVGFRLHHRFEVRFKYDVVEAVGNQDVDVFTANTRLSADMDLRQLEVTLNGRITDDTSLEVAWMPTVAGRSTAHGSTWSFAVVWVGGGH